MDVADASNGYAEIGFDSRLTQSFAGIDSKPPPASTNTANADNQTFQPQHSHPEAAMRKQKRLQLNLDSLIDRLYSGEKLNDKDRPRYAFLRKHDGFVSALSLTTGIGPDQVPGTSGFANVEQSTDMDTSRQQQAAGAGQNASTAYFVRFDPLSQTTTARSSIRWVTQIWFLLHVLCIMYLRFFIATKYWYENDTCSADPLIHWFTLDVVRI